MEVSGALLVRFVESMTSSPLRKSFLVLAVEGESFIELIVTVDILAAKKIYAIMKKKAGTPQQVFEEGRTCQMSQSNPEKDRT